MKADNPIATLPAGPQSACGDRLLKVRDVARLLGVSARQVQKLCSSGRAPKPLKLSRSTRWRESDIARFIAQGCNLASDRVCGSGVAR